jgi:hypothetical protein
MDWSFGDYVRVVTEDDSNLVLSTMKALKMICRKEIRKSS